VATLLWFFFAVVLIELSPSTRREMGFGAGAAEACAQGVVEHDVEVEKTFFVVEQVESAPSASVSSFAGVEEFSGTGVRVFLGGQGDACPRRSFSVSTGRRPEPWSHPKGSIFMVENPRASWSNSLMRDPWATGP